MFADSNCSGLKPCFMNMKRKFGWGLLSALSSLLGKGEVEITAKMSQINFKALERGYFTSCQISYLQI